MNMSRYATQQLELVVRKALRAVAQDDARENRSNRTRPTPALKFGTTKHQLGFRMDNS